MFDFVNSKMQDNFPTGRLTPGHGWLIVIDPSSLRSVTEEIRLSLEDWIERSKSDPQVLKRAETVRAEIEREAQTKRNAIEAIFAKEPTKKVTPPSRDAAKDKAPSS